jgi:hypothetical protein
MFRRGTSTVGLMLRRRQSPTPFSDLIQGTSLANKIRMRLRLLLLAFVFLSATAVLTAAQSARPRTESEIRALIKQSRSKDSKIADAANSELAKLDTKSLPALLNILKTGKLCDRTSAADSIVDLDPNNPALVPALTEIARGGSLRSLFNLQEEMMCRRGATYLLAFSTEGIRVLTHLLNQGDLWERQSAIFAFDELTETSNYPTGSVEIMKDAIPVIAEASKEKDRIMHNMAGEVLEQISGGPNDELSAIARKYLRRNP